MDKQGAINYFVSRKVNGENLLCNKCRNAEDWAIKALEAYQEKKLWNIFHQYQNYDGNFMEDLVGTVLATEEEVETFREKWSKEKRGEDGMIYGIVYAEEVMPNSSLETLIPYYDDFANDYQHMD